MVSERRIVRAMRDAAAYRIAEAVADGKPPTSYSEELRDFNRYRAQHIRMLEEEAKARAS